MVAGEFQEAFTAAIPTFLTVKINALAEDKNVDALKHITVQDKPLAYFNWTSEQSDIGSETETSAAASVGLLACSAVTFLIASMAIL